MLWHINQPTGSSLCGHCCVAMALDKKLEEVVIEIGHNRGTRTEELVRVLRKHRVRCAGMLKHRRGEELPNKALLSMSDSVMRRKNRFHWVLKWRDTMHDPFLCTAVPTKGYVLFPGWKIDFHVEITQCV